MAFTPIAAPGPTLTGIPLDDFGAPVATALNLMVAGLTPALNPWGTYTPIWSGGGTHPDIGNGVLTGKYVRIGSSVGVFQIRMVLGGTSTAGTGDYTWSLPGGWFAGVDTFGPPVDGIAKVINSAVGVAPFLTLIGAINSYSGANVVTVSNAGQPGVDGATTPITWTSGDEMHMHGLIHLQPSS